MNTPLFTEKMIRIKMKEKGLWECLSAVCHVYTQLWLSSAEWWRNGPKRGRKPQRASEQHIIWDLNLFSTAHNVSEQFYIIYSVRACIFMSLSMRFYSIAPAYMFTYCHSYQSPVWPAHVSPTNHWVSGAMMQRLWWCWRASPVRQNPWLAVVALMSAGFQIKLRDPVKVSAWLRCETDA